MLYDMNTNAYLVATNLGYMKVDADSELDAIRWLRVRFGWALEIDYLMRAPRGNASRAEHAGSPFTLDPDSQPG